MRGAYKKDPQRVRTGEPVGVGGIGDAPDRFTELQIAAWKEIVATCHAGVLCTADRIAVELAAVLLADFRSNASDMPAAKLARLDSLLARFGMTPSDRSKVSVPKKPAENPFSKVIKKGSAA